jgi:L-2-hydroxyglutarate oxidase LhgO
MTILDTWKLGETFLKVLARKSNVEIRYDTEVTGYKIQDSNVKKVKTNKGEIDTDLLVLCNGP